jgi:hypothetical protein
MTTREAARPLRRHLGARVRAPFWRTILDLRGVISKRRRQKLVAPACARSMVAASAASATNDGKQDRGLDS